MPRFSVDLPDDEYRKLREYREETGLTCREIIMTGMGEKVKKIPLGRPPKLDLFRHKKDREGSLNSLYGKWKEEK